MSGLISKVEGRMRVMEVCFGLSLLSFGGAIILSSFAMAMLVDNAGSLPRGAVGFLLLSLVHDLGYFLCSVAASVAASRFIESGRLTLALMMVLPNYVYEEAISYISDTSTVYWTWPWGLLGRISLMAGAVAVSIIAQKYLGTVKKAV